MPCLAYVYSTAFHLFVSLPANPVPHHTPPSIGCSNACRLNLNPTLRCTSQLGAHALLLLSRCSLPQKDEAIAGEPSTSRWTLSRPPQQAGVYRVGFVWRVRTQQELYAQKLQGVLRCLLAELMQWSHGNRELTSLETLDIEMRRPWQDLSRPSRIICKRRANFKVAAAG